MLELSTSLVLLALNQSWSSGEGEENGLLATRQASLTGGDK